jgi:flagellar FliJ protein
MSTALNTLLEHSQRERDLALAAVLRAEEQSQRLAIQAQQLDAYRTEYRQRWARQFSRQGAIEIVHCYQSFMERLDEALAQQRQQAEAALAQVLRLGERLQAAEMRMASVRKLIERREAEQRQLQSRRDQRQSDESAQQAHWRGSQFETAPH